MACENRLCLPVRHWTFTTMKGVETRLSAPLAAMALLAVCVLVALLFMIADRVDGDALRHEQALVARGMDAKIADVERVISPR